MITVADFPALVDDLEGIWNEAMKVKIGEMVGNQIFEVRDTNRRTFDHIVLHGVGGVSEVTPGQDLPVVNTDEGDSITWTQRYFGGRFNVTKEMRMFDLHEQIEGLARTLVEDAFDQVDQSYADVLGYGSSTSYTDAWGGTVTSVGPNGLALFSASHTNGVSTSSQTFSNIISNSSGTANVAIARDPIVQARADAMTLLDPEGHTRPVILDTVLVAPSNEDAAERILFSNQISGLSDNDINPLKGKFSLKVWPRLETRSDGTDTSAYWYMYSSRYVGETLKSKFAERPTLDAPEQVFKNKNWEWTTDFFYTTGIGYQPYIFRSTGAN